MDEINFPAIAKTVTDEASAYEFLEDLRWDGRPVCPHCGSVAKHYFLSAKNGGRKTRTGSVSPRRVWKCKDCRKQFSVLTGTIFHGTKIPVRDWIFVVYEMCASKNGVAAKEIQRKYGLANKTAWFMLHRIREAMKRQPLAGLLTGEVMVDETYVGGNPQNWHKGKSRPGAGYTNKTPVVSLLNTETGEVRSTIVPNVNAANLDRVIYRNVKVADSTLVTDELYSYRRVGTEFQNHTTVNHSDAQYKNDGKSTNAVEGFFSQLKRSIDGTHHGVSVEHLAMYLGEFDYRYSTRKMSDGERMRTLIDQTTHRRLSYRPLTERD